MTLQTRSVPLDGMRALAIIAILFYHLMPHVLPGGYLAVNIFFVLTGYFITASVIEEYGQKEKLAYKCYLARRFNRLFLPLLGMLVTVTAYITLFQRDLLLNLRPWLLSSLGMVNNWWQISVGGSYFEQFYVQSPFLHIWFLSVISQFYVIWPLIVLLLMALFKDKRIIFYTAVGLSLFSALTMAMLYVPGEDASRVYYGTDTRLFSFMVGSALSVVWPLTKLNEPVSKRTKRRLTFAAFLSYAILGLMFSRMLDSQTFTYRGGMYLNSIIIGVAVILTAHPATSLSRIMRFKPIQWLGRRSFLLYLWYYPVLSLYQAKVIDMSVDPGRHILIQLVFMLSLSEISYQLFEKKRWKMATFQFWKPADTVSRMKSSGSTDSVRHFTEKIAAFVSFFLLLTALAGFVQARSGGNAAVEELRQQIAASQSKMDEMNRDESTRSRAINNIDGLERETVLFAHSADITFIGDSVLLSVADQLVTIFGQAVVDGAVSRQLYQTSAVVVALEKREQLHDTVVVFLGSNGTFTRTQMETFIEEIGTSRDLFFLTTNVPRIWKDSVNEQLMLAESNHSNVHILDWNAYSSEHDEWLLEDRVHPNPTGAKQLALFVAEEIYQELNDENGSN
ncbi:acyltransferase family protein [Trichococcus collinsii]|uniref:Peptidoglycan/LPS O-acetylase OafA/YrhL, contains acyltransferase and SGNH-hydrolase domains n=1 Tax=Trichococcus collinsii TaxID=157076 RepID=A0AB37ZY61_9LACT|nr:acyltransferase family protein [Trichococcus collinsii]CZQ81171.1 acyltransferase 3 [Trichococcus collinsii]SDZ90813.1 Peptidoglycan/LPS O-acetylase OafA/YrhL, contains acyltransferase and SGNH-hydrolase domains [Trichococcus collinsii]